MPLRLAFLLLTGCIFVDNPCDAPALDCVDAAIRDANGDPDGCDLAACVTCVATCGDGCAVLESYPPQYACDGESFDVYDFCPSWEGPATGPRAAGIEDLGCGTVDGETILATVPTTGHIDVTHTDYLDGCCPDQVQVDVAVDGGALAVTYTLVDDFCDCICGLDVSYSIVDVPAGTWTLRAGPNAVIEDLVVP